MVRGVILDDEALLLESRRGRGHPARV